LTHGEARITVQIGNGLGYRLEVQGADGWRDFGATSRFVDGPGFALVPDGLTQHTDRLVVTGEVSCPAATQPERTVRAPFTLEVRLKAGGWFGVDLEIRLPEAVRFNERGGYEPEVMVQLGTLPPYDRGHSFWARTELLGYSRFDGLPNNDFPAAYFRDPSSRARLIVYLETGEMAWMTPQTMCRWRDYRLGLREAGADARTWGFGMYGVSRSGTRLEPGNLRVAYALHLRDEPRQTNDREALVDLVTTCTARLEPRPDLTYPVSWETLARGASHDLLDDACWSVTPRGEWLRPYVADHSPAWAAVGAWEGKTDNENLGQTPYMLWFQETVLNATLSLAQDAGLGDAARPLLERLERSTRGHYDAVESVFEGYLSSNMTDDGASGAWQYVHSLHQYWLAARRLGRPDDEQKALAELERRAVPLLERHAFVPPTIFHRRTLEKIGPSVSFSVLGVYALLFAELHAAYGESHYLERSRRCLHLLARAPEYAAHQESDHLTRAIAAASLIARHLETEARASLLEDVRFLYAQNLRQFYWNEEPLGSANHPLVRVRGLAACCTPMLYTAFWENIHQLQLHAIALDEFEPHATVMVFLNLIREHAKSGIPHALGQTVPLPFVPLEDVQLIETRKDPGVGQEVYGAGHVFWAYLLLEASLRLEASPDVFALRTNLHRFDESAKRFIVYNTASEARQVRGGFPHASTDARVTPHASSDGVELHRVDATGLEVTLPPRGWLKLTLEP
jgi:hypothetical protein